MWEVTLYSCTKLNMFCTGTFLKTEDCGGRGVGVGGGGGGTNTAVYHSHLTTESK